MTNIQVTHGISLNDARSESVIAINPNNAQQIAGVSRKCIDISAYEFTVAAVYSTDGGITWHDSSSLAPNGWFGLSDPALAWDDSGNIFLIGAAFKNPPKIDYFGIAVYKSTDGGQTWSAPNLIHTSSRDEQTCAASDAGSASFHGRVYVVWNDHPNLRFARTLDHGTTWIGAGADTAGGVLAPGYFPDIDVCTNGDIYIILRGSKAIKMIVSTDGGDSFHPVASPANGITSLESSLSPWKPGGWPVLPGGTFRVFTIPTLCVLGQTVAVAWADYREGISRIYYALSNNGGANWTTGPSGQPLLGFALNPNFQHFHPQIVADPNGVIGCAFYEYGPKPSVPLIDVIMAQSFDGGASFDYFTVTDQPWDPTVDAPISLVDPIATFIGDYFGLDASSRGFYPLWTDTRTGIQELWTAIVPEKIASHIDLSKWAAVFIALFGGVTRGGGGFGVLPGGKVVPIPPDPGPVLNLSKDKQDILIGLAITEMASIVNDSQSRRAIESAGIDVMGKAVKELKKSLDRAYT